VREALIERETLLKAMPAYLMADAVVAALIIKDMRFEGDTPTSKLLKSFLHVDEGASPCVADPWLFHV